MCHFQDGDLISFAFFLRNKCQGNKIPIALKLKIKLHRDYPENT